MHAKHKFCFMGSLQNGQIRNKIALFLKNSSYNYFIGKSSNWLDIYKQCQIILTPRGYGRTSFRLTEVLQLGFIIFITYYIYNEMWLPYYNSNLKWEKMIFLSNIKDISNYFNDINNIKCSKLNQMKKIIISHYYSHFTIDAIFNHIILFMKYGFHGSDLRCGLFYNYH